jgi:hypothetical protein
MQQIRIAKMNANDPDITIISPINAGIICLVYLVEVIGHCKCFQFLFHSSTPDGFFATMNGLATMETAFFGTRFFSTSFA